MEYWGARVTPVPSAVAHYVPSRYVENVQENFAFTLPAGDEDADDIEMINRKIMNQHPEDISLLADRWQNAHDLLASIRQQLLDQSTILYQQHWREAEARDLFMEKGPGETLAYLDDWIDATLSNRDALRALVTIAENSRERMERLYSDYQDDIAAARDLSRWDEIQEDLQIWQGWSISASPMSGLPVIGRDTSGAKEQEAREQVDAVRERYNRDAQRLAREVAGEYMETFSKVSGGHGALFEPMNVVFNPPHPPFPSIPSAPSVTPPAPPPVAPPVPAPPTPPALPPPSIVAPTPPAPPAVPHVPSPTAAPAPPAVPALDGGVVPPAVPVLPAARTGTAPVAPPAVGPGGARPTGAPQPGTAPPALPPGASRPGVHKGVLKGSKNAGAAPALPPSMPPPGRTLGRKPPAPGGKDTERRGSRAAGGPESAFAGPTPPTSPPVLGNPRQAPSRPARKERPPAPGSRATDPPPTGTPAGTVPPVLSAPPPSRTPPPERKPPATRTARPATPDADWVGTGAARASASEPVLGRPTPPTGQPASRLEEVPERLRRRPGRPTAGPEKPRPGKTPPELAPRRAVTDEPAPTEAPLDEDAFHVETPGGGVLAKQQERTTYRPEPPAALGREQA